MSLLNRARADARRILGGEWSTVLSFLAPTVDEVGGEIAVINGTFYRRNLVAEGRNGTPVNSTHVHCTFAEIDLIEEYYPVRNANGLVSFSGHLVTAKDSTGIDRTYIFREWHPDEVLGIIRCILEEYTA